MAALQNSAASTDVNGISFTTLQECPRELEFSVSPTQVLGTETHSPSVFLPTRSVHSASASVNTAVQPSSTPATARPTGSKSIPTTALAAGIGGGVTLIILVGLCLGAAAIFKMAKSEKDTPKSTRSQENSYEEVDNENILGPDRVFHSMYEVDNISIATRTTQLTTDTIYTSVDGSVTEQFLCQDPQILLEPHYATLNPYTEPNTCTDTETSLTISPYQVVLMENRASSHFQETIYAEPDVDNSRNDAETGVQGLRVYPYQALEINREDKAAPQFEEMNDLYADLEPDGASDTETGMQGSRINPYRVSKVLLEEKTDSQLHNGTNHKQYSSLDRHTQYATLEPFMGDLSKDLDLFEDGYSHLNHHHPTSEHTPDTSTIMETPV